MAHFVCMYMMFGTEGLSGRILHINIKCTCHLCVLQIMPGERECAQTQRSDEVPLNCLFVSSLALTDHFGLLITKRCRNQPVVFAISVCNYLQTTE